MNYEELGFRPFYKNFSIILNNDSIYSGSFFKTKYLSFYNESMLRVEREPLHHSNQGYAA